MALLNLQQITLSFGSRPLLDGIDMQIHAGEKISLLGRSGTIGQDDHRGGRCFFRV